MMTYLNSFTPNLTLIPTMFLEKHKLPIIFISPIDDVQLHVWCFHFSIEQIEDPNVQSDSTTYMAQF